MDNRRKLLGTKAFRLAIGVGEVGAQFPAQRQHQPLAAAADAEIIVEDRNCPGGRH